MKRAKWVGAALALVSIAVFSAFDTTPSVGSGHQFWFSAAGTGAVGGAGTALGENKRAISIASFASTVTGCQVVIWSPSIVGGLDTLCVVGSYSNYFSAGIDSIHVLANGAGMSITVNN